MNDISVRSSPEVDAASTADTVVLGGTRASLYLRIITMYPWLWIR